MLEDAEWTREHVFLTGVTGKVSWKVKVRLLPIICVVNIFSKHLVLKDNASASKMFDKLHN